MLEEVDLVTSYQEKSDKLRNRVAIQEIRGSLSDQVSVVLNYSRIPAKKLLNSKFWLFSLSNQYLISSISPTFHSQLFHQFPFFFKKTSSANCKYRKAVKKKTISFQKVALKMLVKLKPEGV